MGGMSDVNPPVAAPMPKHVLALAYAIYRRMTASYQAYLDACVEDMRRGYTPHYCEHGTNRWTDYDNICGGCEDGYSLRDKATRWRLAKAEAVERHQRGKAVLAWGAKAAEHGIRDLGFADMVIARYEALMSGAA